MRATKIDVDVELQRILRSQVLLLTSVMRIVLTDLNSTCMIKRNSPVFIVSFSP